MKRFNIHITPELILEICKSGVICCGSGDGKSKYTVRGLPSDAEFESVEVINYG